MDLSVVIPVRNAEPYIPELFESLASQEFDGSWEVVVSDNGSKDRSLELVEGYRERLPALKVVEAHDGACAAYTRNVGVRSAEGSSLVFIDHDDVPAEGYIAALGQALREHDFVCARQEVETLNPEWATRLLPSAQDTGPMMWNYNFLPYAAGGTLGIRRSLFEAMGGFDESVELSDCMDLCWRIQLETDTKLEFVPEAVLHYRLRHSAREMFKQQRGYGLAEVRMYARYRSRGIKKISLGWSLGNWWRLIRHLPRLRYRAGRAWLATEFGNRVGRVQGSVSNWTLML